MKTTTGILLAVLALAMPLRAGASEMPSQRVTRYMVVVTGGELLAGAYADGHTFFLTRTLRPLGLQCVGAMSVDDKCDDLVAALGFAAERADLVLVTGGLGPTVNDITRTALSKFTGIALREHPDVLDAMARRFGRAPDELGANLRRQTRVPVGGTYLKNPNGTAVGLVFERRDGVIVALPGPPRELQAMVREELVPYLSRRFGTRLPGCSVTLRFVGLGQSQIDQQLGEHVTMPSDVITNSQFGGGRVDFTFSLPDDTPENRRRLEQLKQAILACSGEHIYGEGGASLEAHVVDLLKRRGETLALAEVSSGGTLVAALNGVPDAAPVVRGAYVAPTTAALVHLLMGSDASQPGAGDLEIAALAQRTAEVAGSSWALVVGALVAEGARDGYIEVALRCADGHVDRWREPVRSQAEMTGLRMSTQLLDQLRRRL